jgi:hypothetical protein
MLKIYPPLTPCLKLSVKTFGLAFGFILFLGMVVRLFKGEPLIGFLLIFQLTLLFVGLAAFSGVLLYLILRPWACSVEPTGISGRTYWGQRSRITWDDVENVSVRVVEGIPSLVVTSASSKREVYAYILGVNIPEVYAHLARHAGPDHVLTQWFRPTAA